MLFRLYFLTFLKYIFCFPRDCVLQSNATPEDGCHSVNNYVKVATNRLNCSNLCHIGDIQQRLQIVEIFLEIEKTHKELDLAFVKVDSQRRTKLKLDSDNWTDYSVTKTNFKDEMIQMLIHEGGKTLVGFVDVSVLTLPTHDREVGESRLVHVILGDEVTAFKLNGSVLFKTVFTAVTHRLEWKQLIEFDRAIKSWSFIDTSIHVQFLDGTQSTNVIYEPIENDEVTGAPMSSIDTLISFVQICLALAMLCALVVLIKRVKRFDELRKKVLRQGRSNEMFVHENTFDQADECESNDWSNGMGRERVGQQTFNIL